jgi:hypothetical protein
VTAITAIDSVAKNSSTSADRHRVAAIALRHRRDDRDFPFRGAEDLQFGEALDRVEEMPAEPGERLPLTAIDRLGAAPDQDHEPRQERHRRHEDQRRDPVERQHGDQRRERDHRDLRRHRDPAAPIGLDRRHRVGERRDDLAGRPPREPHRPERHDMVEEAAEEMTPDPRRRAEGGGVGDRDQHGANGGENGEDDETRRRFRHAVAPEDDAVDEAGESPGDGDRQETMGHPGEDRDRQRRPRLATAGGQEGTRLGHPGLHAPYMRNARPARAIPERISRAGLGTAVIGGPRRRPIDAVRRIGSDRTHEDSIRSKPRESGVSAARTSRCRRARPGTRTTSR